MHPIIKHLVLLPLLAARMAQAQTPIAQVRDYAIGTTVTVQGVVLNGSEFGGVRYVQDGTAGIAAFPGTGSVSGFSPARGSNVTVTGVLKDYNGLLEIDPVTAFTVNSTGNALPAAAAITPNQLDEGREGRHVRINGCTFTTGGTFASGNNAFTSNGQSGVVYLRSAHPLVGTAKPTGTVDLLGIGSQYSTANPPSGGYQLLLRNSADIIASTAIAFIGEPQQTGITSSGFTLSWATSLAGSSVVKYGTTPALGSTATGSGGTAAHSVQLTGLQPATWYYAQCLSVLGTDTARSTIGLYSTASSVSGDIKVYFTRPVDNSVATGPLAIALGNATDDTVAAYIGRAQSSIDYAVYNTTNSAVVSALNSAYAAGRTVRVIAEGSNSNSALDNLNGSIPRLFRQNSAGSGMHNKFIAIDADIPAKAVTLTGSTNCTNQSFFTDANNLVVVRDQAVTKAYRGEFNEMWGGTGSLPNGANSRFGAAKTDDTPHWFNVNGTAVEVWFAPSDGNTARVSDALRTADQRVDFALYAFTSSTLTDALIDLRASGRTVRGMIDDMDPTAWNVTAMQAAGIIVRSDNDPTRLLHHKYAIVDAGLTASDPLVITGSFNWSFNAESVNDENSIVIHSPVAANLFLQEWTARWGATVGIDEPTEPQGALLWPVPCDAGLTVMLPFAPAHAMDLRIVDAAGRTVRSWRETAASFSIATGDLRDGAYVLCGADGRARWSRAFLVAH